MRAERFRGSRIRSPSWRNELIEKENRQKARLAPGFFFFADVSSGALRCANLLRTRILTASYARRRAEQVGDSHNDADAGCRAGADFEMATAICARVERRNGVTLFRRAKKNAIA